MLNIATIKFLELHGIGQHHDQIQDPKISKEFINYIIESCILLKNPFFFFLTKYFACLNGSKGFSAVFFRKLILEN